MDNSKLITNVIWSCTLSHGDRSDELSAAAQIEKNRKNPLSYDVGIRRGAVQAVDVSNPHLKGNKLTGRTCEDLDLHGVGIPIEWEEKYEVVSWVEVYNREGQEGHQLRNRIYGIFNEDRKTPLTEDSSKPRSH